jgi:hypothetical protein
MRLFIGERMATSFRMDDLLLVQPSRPMFLCARHEMTYKCIENPAE